MNELNNKIYHLDENFRASLYNHNLYHSDRSNYPRIPAQNFSFENVHMNLGYVR